MATDLQHYSPTQKCPASWLGNLNPTSQFSVGMEIRHHSVFSDYSLFEKVDLTPRLFRIQHTRDSNMFYDIDMCEREKVLFPTCVPWAWLGDTV